jgi:hypothetical protein
MTADAKEEREKVKAARENLNATLATISSKIANYLPTKSEKARFLYFTDEIVKAERLTEWTQAVARLAVWSPLASLGPVRLLEPELQVFIGRFERLLAVGFIPPTHASRDVSGLEHDRDVLAANGVDVRAPDGKAGSGPKMTVTQAARILMEWDRASLLPDQRWGVKIRTRSIWTARVNGSGKPRKSMVWI